MRSRSLTASPNQCTARRGQGAVEFALLIPILVLLLAGAVDLGNGFQTYIALTNAAREGARYGADQPSDTATICTRVQQELPSTITVSCPNVAITFPTLSQSGCTGGSPKAGCPIRVTVTYTLTTILGSILGFNSINLVATIDLIVYNA